MVIEMSKKYEVDVVVVGGGTSGCMAAIAAARLGLSTMLIEKTGVVGGVGATTLMGSFANLLVTTNLKKTVDGIVLELMEKMLLLGAFPYKNIQETVNGKLKAPFTIPYKPELYSQALVEMLEENHVITLLNTNFTDGINHSDYSKTLTFYYGPQVVETHSKVVIDATGNADVAQALGSEINKNSNATHGCLMRIADVDIDRVYEVIKEEKEWQVDETYEPWLRKQIGIKTKDSLGRFSHLVDPLHYDHAPMKDLKDGKLSDRRLAYIEERYKKEGIIYTLELCLIRQMIRRAVEAGDFVINKELGEGKGVTFNGDGIAYGGWGNGVVLCNIAKPYGFDPSDVEDNARASIEARTYNMMALNFLKKYVKGFEDSYLLDMGSEVVCRFSRCIKGLDDVQSLRDNLLFAQPIYIFGGIYEHQPGIPVPYGKIVSKNIPNLFSVGKCSSNGQKYRSQISCMSMGVAAGAAASVICSNDTTSHNMKKEDLANTLLSINVILEMENKDA